MLDPWNGSGTTTMAAARLGLRSYGVDLNPFAALIAQAKTVSFSSPEDAVEFGQRILGSTNTVRGPSSAGDLSRWISQSLARRFVSLGAAIVEPQGVAWPPEPQRAFAMLALIRAARCVSPPKSGSNPTWFRPPMRRKQPSRDLAEEFLKVVQSLAADGLLIAKPVHSPRILVGDARALPVQEGSVDVVLTSPPYCTRIDYAASTAFELACLAAVTSRSDAGSLRRELMGTTMIRTRVPHPIPDNWAPSVRSLLEQIRSHSSYASSGYYFKNFWQYFNDAHLALGEIARALRRGGVAALVLQTSFYKEILIDLPALYTAIGKAHGLHGGVVVTRSLPSSRVMASLHPKAKSNRVSRRYEESVLLLEKP
ncbi:class I SAM-dependent methyltransferase [Corallococcus sp. AB018]|uniref:class I SAM-dependent methyltransferase n=1 Tax=Corallococcus sp. AB018 TaxID=2316715 RepID=UPI001315055A|nr:class I SAM-dependent methyltransferase [Corallococcus sp. AB018]